MTDENNASNEIENEANEVKIVSKERNRKNKCKKY